MNKKNMYIILVLFFMLLLNGCSLKKDTPLIKKTDFKLNTIVSITVFDQIDAYVLDESLSICDTYENIFSRTMKSSELYALNHRENMNDNMQIKLSPELNSIFEISLQFCKLSNGRFDITLEPLTSLWDFSSDNPVVPLENAINLAKETIGYQNFSLYHSVLTLPKDSTTFDFGGIAKGYIADRIKEYLVEEDVESAIIDLGGNILCIGSKPDGTPFQIGIQKPFADRNETDLILNIRDQSVVSSGIYERYFEENGIVYHHILDPLTGYPVENNLLQVTIISSSSVDGDALSTACFALGLEDGLKLVNSFDNIDAIFMTKDSKLIFSDAFPQEYLVN